MLKRTELKKKGKNRSFISWIQFLTETELFENSVLLLKFYFLQYQFQFKFLFDFIVLNALACILTDYYYYYNELILPMHNAIIQFHILFDAFFI